MKAWIFSLPYCSYGETPEEAWENACDYGPEGNWLCAVFDPQQMPDAERDESCDCDDEDKECKDESEAGRLSAEDEVI